MRWLTVSFQHHPPTQYVINWKLFCSSDPSFRFNTLVDLLYSIDYYKKLLSDLLTLVAKYKHKKNKQNRRLTNYKAGRQVKQGNYEVYTP